MEQRKEVLDSVREEGEKALDLPKVITHTVDGGSRIAEKDNVYKLPYMNRNPAV